MRNWIDLVENAGGPLVLYHITDNANFKLDPDYAPEDNALSINPRDGHKGIYLARDVERWVNGHGYIRPYVAEIEVDPEALEHDHLSRWGGEVFVPAEHFDKLKVRRVIPLDAHCREVFGAHGWIETSHGQEFDTGRTITDTWPPKFRGWQYDGDTRNKSPEEIAALKAHFDKGYEARMSQR